MFHSNFPMRNESSCKITWLLCHCYLHVCRDVCVKHIHLHCSSCLCTLSVGNFTWNLFRSCGPFKAKHWAPSNDLKVLVSNHFNWACYYPSNLKIIGSWLCGWNCNYTAYKNILSLNVMLEEKQLLFNVCNTAWYTMW